MNVIASDQYIAIVLPGRMFRAEYRRRGLHPKNLSRSLEDAGTLTSVLVPWNTCGAFMAQTLGVATFAYAPFAFFNLINPLVAAIYGFTGFTIERPAPEIRSGDPGMALRQHRAHRQRDRRRLPSVPPAAGGEARAGGRRRRRSRHGRRTADGDHR
jgi:hypothetical protein